MQDGIKKRLKVQAHLIEDQIYDLRLRMVRNPDLAAEIEAHIFTLEIGLLNIYQTLEMFD